MTDLFARIVEFENLHAAYLGARSCKRYRSSILKFGYKLEENLLALHFELTHKTYKHGGYREFVVTDSKKRTIKAAPFRDRVVHHAICNIIEPILDRSFIFDSYACRKGKGTHAAIIRLERFIKSLTRDARERERERERERDVPPPPATQAEPCEALRAGRIYCLKCDVSKYFDNVDHQVLLGMLHWKIQDEDILWLLREIIASNTKGIPIGNLTSQLFANVYLNELDHFVKRELREPYYLRYMDDFLIVGLDKKHLLEDKEKIRIFLRDKLKLELHPKKAEIFPIDRGVDFLGYVVRGNKRFLRKSTVKRILKKRKRYEALLRNGKISEECTRNVFISWRGYTKFADSYMLAKKLKL